MANGRTERKGEPLENEVRLKVRTNETTEMASTPTGTQDEDDIFVKYSQSVDIEKVLHLQKKEGKVYNEENQRILFIPFTKNMKISKKLDLILKHLTNDNGKEACKEAVFVSSGESIQKMITVIEILKQKLVQLQDYDAKHTFVNDTIAKMPDANKLVIGGKDTGKEGIKLNYNQLNFLDYTLVERDMRVGLEKESMESHGLYDGEMLRQVLKVEKLIRVPVMYVYMNFHQMESLPVKYVNKFKNLTSAGWSIQQS